jgi:hypothetical protein
MISCAAPLYFIDEGLGRLAFDYQPGVGGADVNSMLFAIFEQLGD